jgi:hypothetical protein
MRKKDKVMVVMIRNGEQIGRFRAYLAWSVMKSVSYFV